LPQALLISVLEELDGSHQYPQLFEKLWVKLDCKQRRDCLKALWGTNNKLLTLLNNLPDKAVADLDKAPDTSFQSVRGAIKHHLSFSAKAQWKSEEIALGGKKSKQDPTA